MLKNSDLDLRAVVLTNHIYFIKRLAKIFEENGFTVNLYKVLSEDYGLSYFDLLRLNFKIYEEIKNNKKNELLIYSKFDNLDFPLINLENIVNEIYEATTSKKVSNKIIAFDAFDTMFKRDSEIYALDTLINISVVENIINKYRNINLSKVISLYGLETTMKVSFLVFMFLDLYVIEKERRKKVGFDD